MVFHGTLGFYEETKVFFKQITLQYKMIICSIKW